MSARRLTRDECRDRVVPALTRTLKNPIGLPEPFLAHTEGRLVLECSAFALHSGAFRAVSLAAQNVGDTSLFLTLLADYWTGLKQELDFSWEIPLGDYQAYDRAPHDDEEVIPQYGIALYRVLHSPQGIWSIVCDDDFAVVGGSLAFTERLKLEHPAWPNDLRLFLKGCQDALARDADMDWVPVLLRHVYGPDAPEFGPLDSSLRSE